MIDLDNARKVIAAEECEKDYRSLYWCRKHDYHWPRGASECKGRPDVADVAADLLAAAERVQALADELGTTNTSGRVIGKSIRDRLEGADND